jgi:twitching motility protein PilT
LKNEGKRITIEQALPGQNMLKPLLEKVLKPGVSDLHLKAFEPPLIRHIGQLIPIGTTPLRPEDIETMVSSMLTEHQQSLFANTGSIDFSYPVEGVGRLRINVYRQKSTLAVAVRIIPGEPKTFDELNLPKDIMEKVARTTRGLVLISGVTGAGKTTTLNAVINFMNENFSYNIITVEDPIELIHHRKKSSISQREVGRDVESLSDGMRNILRQDPDVIVIGEMRSENDFKAAIECAGSGHLVLATIHSSDCTDAIDRIVNAFDFQEQSYVRSQLCNVIKSVVSQRLVPGKKDPRPYPATETLTGTLQIKKLLASNSVAEVRFQLEKGSAFGMHSFDQDLYRMVQEGLITQEMALGQATNTNDFRLKLQGLTAPGEPGK